MENVMAELQPPVDGDGEYHDDEGVLLCVGFMY